MAFLGGSNAGVRRVEGARRGAFCFEYRRDDVAHVLPQKGLLWRNLITLFRCVNSFTEKNSALSLGHRAAAAGLCLLLATHRRPCFRERCEALFENAVINAVSNLHHASAIRSAGIASSSEDVARQAC
jgi:hypothetical protein